MNGKSYKTDNKSNNIVLIVVIAMTFMATLDSSIVNVALPVLSHQLSVPISSIEWVAASYSMIICSTILFFGRLGDIIGKSRIFHIGTILFTLASLLCGLSTSFAMLIACRFLQGIGASAYMANNHGIITELFPRESRGKALGILVTAVAIGNMVGPSVGGMILSVFHWNYIFYVNVPFGMIVFLLGIKFLPRGRKKTGKIRYSRFHPAIYDNAIVFWFPYFVPANKHIPSIYHSRHYRLHYFRYYFRLRRKEEE